MQRSERPSCFCNRFACRLGERGVSSAPNQRSALNLGSDGPLLIDSFADVAPQTEWLCNPRKEDLFAGASASIE